MTEIPELDSKAYANFTYNQGNISKQMHSSDNSNNDIIHKVIILFFKCFNFYYVIHLLYVTIFVTYVIQLFIKTNL